MWDPSFEPASPSSPTAPPRSCPVTYRSSSSSSTGGVFSLITIPGSRRASNPFDELFDGDMMANGKDG